MLFIYIILFLFSTYSFLILLYFRGWRKIPVFISPEHTKAVGISVIIPARNEEENIENLLKSLLEQSYQEEYFEIIVVDDHSTDNTAFIVNKYVTDRIHLISIEDDNLNSYKKKAIETGIAKASGQLIVTTDADCIVPKDWLKTIASYYSTNNFVFIAAPVVFDNDNSFFQVFQSLDFMVLQGITGASIYEKFHSMGNGANLAYEKKAFFEVGGFSGIDSIASGDDMLLMHKFNEKYPNRIGYLKAEDAIVSTKPSMNWKEFLNQRKRWASKINHYQDKRVTAVLALVYFFNLSILSLFIAGFWQPQYWYFTILFLFFKFFVELPLVFSVAVFFKKLSLLKYFILFQPIHVLYTVVAGFLGLTGKYEWKNRKVN